MDERFGEIPPETPPEDAFPPVVEEHHEEELQLMQRYSWRRGVCQQQLGDGFDDIRDC